MRDLAIVAISILAAVLLAKTEILKDILAANKESILISSFISGLFWTSVFTTAPATVALAEIAQFNSILLIAFVGGIGALIGDLIIFRFVKNHLAGDIDYLMKKTKKERWFSIFKLKIFRWLIPLIGALVIASPLPDELGLALMGVARLKTAFFIPVSFAMNFLGILIIGSISKAFFS